jgi:serine/threonine-protein kinase RIO1
MSELDKAAHSEHERLISRLLSDRKKAEVLKWLKGGSSEDKRIVGGCKTNRESIRFVKEIYDAGAIKIFAVQIHKKRGSDSHRTGKLVAELPQDAKARKAIFAWCKKQGDSLGFSPEPDRDESHLFLLLD